MSDYCDLARPIYFSSMESLDAVMKADEQLVRDVVAHNETIAQICGLSDS